ncbi:MAG: TonB-dependent receptor [Bacteroidetes bacterium]|nr:TonB-dependent receptor [Bacteroidota bacterium]
MKIYTYCTLVPLLWLLSVNALAQRPNMPSYNSRPAIAQISGTIVDSVSSTPLEYATIALILVKNDSLITGAITDNAGKFLIENIRPARYTLRVDYLGYKTKISANIMVGRNNISADAGTISLVPNPASMAEVEVEVETDFIINQIDRKVYNIAKNLTTEGSTAIEVLENIPSIDVDIDGNLSLRGSGNVTVLIDGKPSGLTGASRTAILDQIPASTIESIEIITNPSAKYDPDGMSGIINIILKKNKKLGLNGGVTLSVGNNNKYSGSANLSYRNKKINLFSSYSYRYDERYRNGTNFRESSFSDSTFYLDQYSNSDRISSSQMLKLGMDIYLNDKNTLSISGFYSLRDRDRLETIQYYEKDENENVTDIFYRENDKTSARSTMDYRLGYEKKFRQPKRKFTANVNFSNSSSDDIGNYSEQTYLLSDTPDGTDPDLQHNNTNTSNYIATIDADYVHPFSKKAKMELGYKSIFRSIDSDINFKNYDYTTGKYVSDTALNNNFIYNEQVHAIYGIYARQVNKFSFQLGARVEQALTVSELVTTSDTFNHNYFSVFPSLHLSQKFKKDQEVMLSYSRRINRPSRRTLNPFYDQSDPLNLRYGNPNLDPEYINSFELSYAKYFDKSSFTSSVYYKNVNNVIQRIKTIDSVGVTTTTYLNLNSSTSYGAEGIAVVQLKKWWKMNMSFNFYRSILDGSNLEAELNNNAYSWSTKMMTNLKLWKDVDLQISGRYRAPIVITQGTISEIYTVDVGLKQKILKKKGSINLAVRDIFNTRKFGFEMSGEGFSQVSVRQFESRVATLSFSYRFGSEQAGKRKRKRPDAGGGQNEEPEFEVD